MDRTIRSPRASALACWKRGSAAIARTMQLVVAVTMPCSEACGPDMDLGRASSGPVATVTASDAASSGAMIMVILPRSWPWTHGARPPPSDPRSKSHATPRRSAGLSLLGISLMARQHLRQRCGETRPGHGQELPRRAGVDRGSYRPGSPAMRRRLPVLMLVAALSLGAASGAAFAQTTQQDAQDPGSAPRVTLSEAQRHTIYQSVSRTQKNNAAPTGFRVSIGATLPPGVELAPMPDTLVTLMPEAKPFAVAMIEKQVVLVDPSSRRVAVVITAEE
ncbi:hypothetical protein CH341_04045 [Rhodoplanes roseus]|uniref:DUF1236 domain-containing protein n=2 Tax=Rhodoplanes roseus TaxID=29409 RepID=A0A327L3A1_9BRAD|nr:hypothetical protein CH341_04045 [Rhodoplanes roseus]